MSDPDVDALLTSLEADLLLLRQTRADVVDALGDLTSRAPRGQGWTFDSTAVTSGLSLSEGRTFVLRASTAGARLSSPDKNRTERASSRAQAASAKRADVQAQYVALRGWRPVCQGSCQHRSCTVMRTGAPSATRQGITEWSAKSRARMAETIASLDYSPMDRDGTVPGMVTVTYPGNWQAVAPTGRAVKHHLEMLRRTWADTFGWPPVGLWKLEFQRRGAPHLHFYLPVPAVTPSGERFETWLSRTWAHIVGATGEDRVRHERAGTGVDFSKAERAVDPRRLAIYFLKHGTKTKDAKEYQHQVPPEWQEPGAGPGRFWGYWGLDKTTVDVHLDLHEYVAARRVMRHILKARAWRMAKAATLSKRWDVVGRPPRTLTGSRGLDGGFVLVNDGVRLAHDLTRYLSTLPRGVPPCP